MKSKLLAALFALILPLSVAAQPFTADEEAQRLVGLSMIPEWAYEISQYVAAGSAVYPNNTYLKWENAAGTADVSAFKVDATDDTVVNADSGDVIKLSVNGTAELSIDNDLASFSGTAATIEGAGSVTIKADADTGRVFVFDATADDALSLAMGLSTTASAVGTIKMSTIDTDDDQSLCLTGAGACGLIARGAYAQLDGNEFSGSAYLTSGNIAGSDVTLSATDDLVIEDTAGADVLVVDVATKTAAFTTTGGTLAVDSGTAASACKGTLTANGATPVVTSTSCAATASIPILQKVNASTAANGTCTVTAISNGVSFTTECLANDTGTYGWWILKEG